MNRIKYLVRQLTLIEGGAYQELSLQYIDLKEGELHVFPFDFERAGFIYVPELTLIKASNGWEVGESSTFIS
ncbi:MAG: hypothetical protein K2J63_13635 [Muribaculaceae bacterium]|nr:hypothetical protein [Muribaculaceae bacterium]MDE6796330.1 hypothetical protein [Muribaculaceae bacterium]